MTRVAFDVRETSHMSHGVLTYARRLREWLPRVAPDVQLVPVGRGDNFDLAEQLGLPLALARSRAALAHFPTIYTPRVLPLRYVVTIHDLIDLHYPRYVKPQVGAYWRAHVGPVARGARAVITDDPSTVLDLERFLRVDPARVRVVPLGADPSPPVVPMTHPRPYLLYVTNRRPHKNVAMLVRAWRRIAGPLDLVLSGADDGTVTATREDGAIVHLGHRPDDELRRWYAGAAVYAHPALREGFGLPMLEAMRAGVPVVASRSAVPAVLAPFATLVDAYDVEAWSDALAALLADRAAAAARAQRALAGTAALTWESTARLTAAVYREAAG